MLGVPPELHHWFAKIGMIWCGQWYVVWFCTVKARRPFPFLETLLVGLLLARDKHKKSGTAYIYGTSLSTYSWFTHRKFLLLFHMYVFSEFIRTKSGNFNTIIEILNVYTCTCIYLRCSCKFEVFSLPCVCLFLTM